MADKKLDLLIAIEKPNKEKAMNDEKGYNKIEFGEGTFENPEDGQKVDFTGSGTIVKKPDGSFCVEAEVLNEVPVSGNSQKPESPEGVEETEEVTEEEAPDYSMRADEAADKFFKNRE